MLMGTKPDPVMRVAKCALATILLAALLASIAPLQTFAIGPMCNLACCAGRAPHAAGSCMDGTCHLALNKRATHHNRFEPRVAERFCGFPLQMRRGLSRGQTTAPIRSKNSESKGAQLSSSILTKPCLADCGGCASGFAAADYRNHAAVAERCRARPRCVKERANAPIDLLPSSAALVRQHPPRGPPINFF